MNTVTKTIITITATAIIFFGLVVPGFHAVRGFVLGMHTQVDGIATAAGITNDPSHALGAYDSVTRSISASSIANS